MGDRLDIVMELLRLTSKKVAEDIGVSSVMVSRYRRGINEPSYKILTAFCRAYNVNIEWMATGNGEVFRIKDIEREKEAKKILREVAIIKVEKKITNKEIQEKLGLPKGFFTDLRKGKISMPADKRAILQQIYKSI